LVIELIKWLADDLVRGGFFAVSLYGGFDGCILSEVVAGLYVMKSCYYGKDTHVLTQYQESSCRKYSFKYTSLLDATVIRQQSCETLRVANLAITL